MSEVREIPAEVKESLQGLSPFSASCTTSYTPTNYKAKDETGAYRVPEAYWPVFELRPWSKSEVASWKKVALTNKSMDDAVATGYIRKAVIGWSNLIDAGSGEDISFEADADGGCDKGLFDQIPTPIIIDLLNKIMVISGIKDVSKSL